MIRPMHRLFWLGLPMVFTMAGCAGMKLTDFGHRNPTPIGDRPLSVINGRTAEESATRSNSITSTIDAKDARRISGRVMDHRGQPVSGATVRLADGALAGGSVSDVITDEAGGFTVRGLRASTPYTLIATLDLGGESRISRARFLSGETQARVLLEPDSSDQSARDQVEDKPANRPKLTTAKIESRQDQPSPPKGKWVFVEDGQNAEETAKVALKLKDKSLQKVSDERERQMSLKRPTRRMRTPHLPSCVKTRPGVQQVAQSPPKNVITRSEQFNIRLTMVKIRSHRPSSASPMFTRSFRIQKALKLQIEGSPHDQMEDERLPARWTASGACLMIWHQ